jgi:hypothetical protein
LPVPVWACAMTSLPAMSNGMVSSCTGVGSMKPIFVIARITFSSILSEVNPFVISIRSETVCIS